MIIEFDKKVSNQITNEFNYLYNFVWDYFDKKIYMDIYDNSLLKIIRNFRFNRLVKNYLRNKIKI